METIDDIVREMRVMARVSDNGYCAQFCLEFADRIEAAYSAQLSKGEMCTMSCRESGALIEQYAQSERRLTDEVKRLRAALKPVLDCNEYAECGECDVPNTDGAYDAVRDAQRIYDESKVV